MLRTTVRILAFVGVAVLLLSMTPAYAEEGPAVSTPDHPMALSSDWVTLNQGETHIYKFHYKSTTDKFGGGGPAPMSIYFYTQPDGAARLTVRNADQIRKWGNSGVNEWFGMATPQQLTFKHNCNSLNKPGTGSGYDKECHNEEGGRIWDPAKFAHWEASMAATGDYWVVVQVAPGRVGPVDYKIVATGPAFRFVW